jgi:hypothetical protein
MTRLKFRLFPAVFVLALAASGCDISLGEHGFSMGIAAGKAQNEWTKTYTLGAGGQFEIVNVNGTITATPSDGGEVQVRAERIAKASSDEAAQELLKKIEIAETASGNRVRLETKAPRQSFGSSGHEVRYHVKVPKGLSVNFVTVNGGVRMENLEGQIVATTTNGGVRGSRLKGPVKASTTNGGVQLSMAAVTGEIELETTNGGIQLQLPEDAKATLEARCTNGGIRVEDALTVDASERSRRNFRGTLNGGGPRISVETTNGGIRVSGLRASAETS